MFIDDEDVIKSVQRVFEIFEWFDNVRQPARATTVARSLGYPISSSTSLLKSMSQRGYLAFNPIRQEYFPTLQLTYSASWMDQGWYETARLRALVHELHEETGELVTLSYQNDLEMVFLDVTDPFQTTPVPVTTATQAPLFRSAVGFTSLSCRPDREVAQLVERYNRRVYRPAAKADPDYILANVIRTRVLGHCVGHELCAPERSAIAWPLPAPKAGPIVIVAVAGAVTHLRADEKAIMAAGRVAIQRTFGSQVIH